MLTKSLQLSTLGVALLTVSCTAEPGIALPPLEQAQAGGHTSEQQTTSSKAKVGTGGSKSASGGATANDETEAEGGNGGAAETTTSRTTQSGGSKATTGTGGKSGGGTSQTTGGTSSGKGASTTASTGGARLTTPSGGTGASLPKTTNAAGGNISTTTGAATTTNGTGGNTAATTGTTTSVTDPNAVDPCSIKTMPTGGQVHSATWAQGGKDNLAWQIWSNGTAGSITTFDTTAFSASWNGSNFLGRLGYEWGNNPKNYKDYGEITIDFNSIKSGNAGGRWSYVGVYGWTNNPCIEWYIIEDSFSPMPFNLGGDCYNMSNSPLAIDGGEYIICKRSTPGTGGDRCGGAANWNQYYSIRKTARTCGRISVTKHFDAWTATGGNTMGKLLEVKVLVETGAGTGKVDFPIAKVMATSP
jgi:endo-1,4-beta-xylanase